MSRDHFLEIGIGFHPQLYHEKYMLIQYVLRRIPLLVFLVADFRAPICEYRLSIFHKRTN